MQSKQASEAARETPKILPYTLDNDRCVTSRRVVKEAVLVARSVFEISNICQNWSFVARPCPQRFLRFQSSYGLIKY